MVLFVNKLADNFQKAESQQFYAAEVVSNWGPRENICTEVDFHLPV